MPTKNCNIYNNIQELNYKELSKYGNIVLNL